MLKDDHAAVMVLTSETRQSILENGNSGDWVLNPKNVSRCQYLVCCRKLNWKNRAEGTPHRAGFLVGRIAGLKKLERSENKRLQPRYRIALSEYAELSPLAEIWRKELRNPVAYDTLKNLGIELRRLRFKPIPLPQPTGKSGEAAPMTIAEAKKALAATFGVKPEDVEITVRG
jgi:hypothetical protein